MIAERLERVVLTVPECAKYLTLGRSAAYEAIRRGDIPSIRIGRRILIPRAALDRLLAGAGQRQPDGAQGGRP